MQSGLEKVRKMRRAAMARLWFSLPGRGEVWFLLFSPYLGSCGSSVRPVCPHPLQQASGSRAVARPGTEPS